MDNFEGIYKNHHKYFNGHPGVTVLQSLSDAKSLKLTLINKFGNIFHAGYLYNAKAARDHVTLTWVSDENIQSESPFDTAILWEPTRKKVIAVSKIAPTYVKVGDLLKIDYPF